MDVENHGAGVLAKDGVRIGGTIIEKLCDGDGGSGRAVGLCRRKGPERHEHVAINGACVVLAITACR